MSITSRVNHAVYISFFLLVSFDFTYTRSAVVWNRPSGSQICGARSPKPSLCRVHCEPFDHSARAFMERNLLPLKLR